MDINIIGAGLGGLTLANVLQETGHKVHIFERDKSANSRPQGYGIGLNGDAGQRVLNELNLLQQAKEFGQPLFRFPFLLSDGEEIFTLEMPPAYALLSISRDDLRRMLIERVGENNIAWGKTFVGYEAENEKIKAKFIDGSVVKGDLLIGFDGLRSKVYKQLHNKPLNYLGLVSVGGMLTGSELCNHRLLQGGAFLSIGDRASMYVQTYTNTGKVLWAYSSHQQEEWGRNLDGEQLKAEVYSRIRTWHEPIPTLVKETTVENMGQPIPIYDREPVRSTVNSRVILLGDAAHPMSPYQGQGANLAMLDALELGTMLTGCSSKVEWSTVASFMEIVWKRASSAVLTSRQAAVDFHAENALERIAAWKQGPQV